MCSERDSSEIQNVRFSYQVSCLFPSSQTNKQFSLVICFPYSGYLFSSLGEKKKKRKHQASLIYFSFQKKKIEVCFREYITCVNIIFEVWRGRKHWKRREARTIIFKDKNSWASVKVKWMWRWTWRFSDAVTHRNIGHELWYRRWNALLKAE